MQAEALRALFASIMNFIEAADGDSGDAEHDAAYEMKEAAIAYILASTSRDAMLSEIVDEYNGKMESQANALAEG